MPQPPCILTIAGSDSGGGAGIQADLKTIAMLGGFGASVITALTAQNTSGVAGIHAPPARFVAQQLKAVLSDMPVAAAKTGMLFSAAIVKAVAAFLRDHEFPLVVDPVCVAQSGARLLEPDAVEVLAERLFPVADLVTPNVPEAEVFAGMEIKTAEQAGQAAERILALGPRAVLVKGGHMDSVTATDWFVERGARPIPLIQPRVATPYTHGTGCALSAAIAAGLGQGLELVPAVRRAQRYLNTALRAGFKVGKGGGSPNHLVPLLKEQARRRVLDELARAGRALAAMPGLARLVPEVRMNLAVALPFAEGEDEVAAFSGRISCDRRGAILIAGCPEFGASSHMARALLAARRIRAELSCAANIRLDTAVLAALERAGITSAWFDRADEPAHAKAREGGSLEWGVLEALGRHPDPGLVEAVCDKGEIGKEPVVRLFAADVDGMLGMLARILSGLEGK
jgi:hydroxymethylpyrimidine/phosphomethylpyrimidine kinase